VNRNIGTRWANGSAVTVANVCRQKRCGLDGTEDSDVSRVGIRCGRILGRRSFETITGGQDFEATCSQVESHTQLCLWESD
jgi:hypothetical protein